jgi:hypothetical protein
MHAPPDTGRGCDDELLVRAVAGAGEFRRGLSAQEVVPVHYTGGVLTLASLSDIVAIAWRMEYSLGTTFPEPAA